MLGGVVQCYTHKDTVCAINTGSMHAGRAVWTVHAARAVWTVHAGRAVWAVHAGRAVWTVHAGRAVWTVLAGRAVWTVHAGRAVWAVHALHHKHSSTPHVCVIHWLERMQASIETIIESEDQVRALMDKVDEALVEVGLIEQNLNEYAFMLNSVRSATEKTDSQFRHVIVEDRNLFELKEALADLVVS